MKKKLTDNERKTYEFIRSRIRQGYPPSVREICGFCGFRSTSTAHRMINTLTEKGYLEKADHLNRAIRLAGGMSVKVPVLGQIDTTLPLTAAEQVESYIDFVPQRVFRGELFAVSADAGIEGRALMAGDLVIAEEGAACAEGDIAVTVDADGNTHVGIYSNEKPIGKAIAIIRHI